MSFKPTVAWMEKKYDEMNSLLFRNKLMGCDFGIFTSGRGSEGKTLGWFKICGKNLYAERRTGRMYRDFGWDREYVTNDNFVSLCKPKIALNGNYSGKEESFLTTLVHEMCHYYTFMDGYSPAQTHGREFKNICSIIEARSNGRFSIRRLASAEQMAGFELNDKMKAKKEKRLKNTKSKTTVLIYWDRDGNAKMVTTTSADLVRIIKLGKYKKLIVSNDGNLFDFLYNTEGYRNNMRIGKHGWTYWIVTTEKWLNDLDKYNIEVYENGEKVGTESPAEQPKPEPPKEAAPRKVFTIKTNKGVVEIPMENSMKQMFDKVKERLPNLSDDAVMRLINNPANYKVVKENRFSTKRILREVIEEFVANEDNDSVAINPNMNLGLKSPLEDDV